MPNTLLNSDVLTSESLMHFENELVFYKLVSHQWDPKFGIEGAKIGDTLRIRDAQNATIREGQKFTAMNLEDRAKTLTLDTQLGVDFTILRNEMTLSIDQISKRYLQPFMRRLANEVDRRIAGLYKKVANAIGTYNAAPTTIATFLEAKAKLDTLGVPDDERHFVLDPVTETTIVGNLTTVFQAVPEVGKQYMKGRMGNAIGAEWHHSANVNAHTSGALGGTPLVKGANQTGATVIIDGWTASVTNILKEGDIITLAAVNAVNAITGEDTGQLRQFRVTADTDSDSSGETATLSIWPSIITSGPYKTCTQSPANDAIVLIHGHASTYAATVVNSPLYFHPEWATCCIAPQEVPSGTHMASMKSDPDSGIGLSFVMDYDIDDNLYKCRFDILFGLLAQLPDFACRVYTS